MKQFWKTTVALFKKDLKDSIRNVNMAIMLLVPPIFAALFKFSNIMDLNSSFMLVLITTMALSMIPLSYLATIIAEEKEKNTMRTLMLSGVSASEFLTSKILVVWLLLQVVNIIDVLLTGYPISRMPMFLLIIGLGSIPLLMLGAAIGIASKDQMSTNVVVMPVMLLLMFPALLGEMIPFLGKLAKFNPIVHMMNLFFAWEDGTLFKKDSLLSLLVFLVWTVVCILLFAIIYRRKRVDK